jgi:protein-tyrosine phosphatase
VTTVVDLRAEDDASALDGHAEAAGLDVVHLPIRDGQLPTAEQIVTFDQVVAASPGTVFLHCGAGVGRTGAMAAAHLVGTGQVGGAQAVARNLAVGPPSLEQVVFAASFEASVVDRPPLPVVALSRFLDAPRRIWHNL